MMFISISLNLFNLLVLSILYLIVEFVFYIWKGITRSFETRDPMGGL